MHNTVRTVLAMTILSVMSSCTMDEIVIPADELYTREFIKSYGVIDPNHDWSVLKKSSITVTTPTQADVRVYVRDNNGKTTLVAHYREVEGTETIHFDVPKETEVVYVQSGTYFNAVPLESSVALSSARSRAIDGKDNLPGYSLKNGYYFENKYASAMASILPEGKNLNIQSKDVTADFSFISTGSEFVLYPVYWNTTGHDVLGVYWYEDGQMKTMDVFDNKVDDSDIGHHNIYHRATKGSELSVTQCSPADGAVDVESDGEITLSFSRAVKKLDTHKASLSQAGATLGEPRISDDGRTVTYPYSGLANNETVTFTLSANSFVASDNAEGDTYSAINSQYTISFTTADNTPTWLSTTYTIQEDGKTCEAKLVFNKPVTISDGAVSVDNGATVSGITASGDKCTYTVTISCPDFATLYTMTLDNTNITSAEDSSVKANITGYDASSKNKFSTPEDPAWTNMKFVETATKVEFTCSLNSGYVQINDVDITENADIVGPDEPLTVKLHMKDGGRPKGTNGESSLQYQLAGSSESVSFEYGLRIKSKSLAGVTDITEAVDGNDYVILEVTPSDNMLLTVHGFMPNTSSTLEDSAPLMWDINDGKDLDKVTSYSSTLEDKGWTLLVAKYKLAKGKSYYIHVKPSKQVYVAGLSYQLEDTSSPAELSYTRQSVTYRNTALSRGSRATSGTGVQFPGANGSIPDFWRDGEEPGHGYVRNTRNNGLAVSIDNMDEILTHRVSFTLPKGTIFGFYLRNNTGAIRITNPGEGPAVPYTAYSMSALNREVENSLFNSLDLECSGSDGEYFQNGWGTKGSTKDGRDFHEKLDDGHKKMIDIPAGREYSTAMTYTVDVDGQEMRFFSFEDWVDCDFNDIVFMVAPEVEDEIIDLEIDTDPYIFAVEDLGATAKTDIDFNDAVFAAEHISSGDKSTNYVFVTMLAAGGTLPIQLYFDGKPVTGMEEGQEIVGGPYVGAKMPLMHINQWFGIDDTGKTVNVAGVGGVNPGFGNLTTVRIEVGADFSFASDSDDPQHFSLKVERTDGTKTEITRPDAKGQAPQIIILPGKWRWPKENRPIHDAFPGGIGYDGTLLGSFESWISNCFDKTASKWHESPVMDYVVDHAWTGSQAARDAMQQLNSGQ